MKLIYGIEAKPPIGKSLLFAFQQMIAIMAATLLVPMLMSGMKTHDGASLVFDPAAALFGAGIGTIVYLLFTKEKALCFWEVHSPSSARTKRSSDRITAIGASSSEFVSRDWFM